MARGPFIALEGIDGTGLSTQATILHRHLSARMSAILTKEPTDGPIGRAIRSALSPGEATLTEEAMALLFAADRAIHTSSVILPSLSHGTAVVSDRYVLSSYAYQSVTLDLDWLLAINRSAPLPDVSVVVTIDPPVALERIALRDHRERYEERSRLEHVLENYLYLAERLGETMAIRIIDGAGAIEDVAERVWDAVVPYLSPAD